MNKKRKFLSLNPDGRSLLRGEEGILNGKMDRRAFLSRSSLLAALAAAGINNQCNEEDDNRHDDPPPPPEPVYENKFGLYDNFDG